MMKCSEIFSSSEKDDTITTSLSTILDVLACQISYENKATELKRKTKIGLLKRSDKIANKNCGRQSNGSPNMPTS